MNALRDLTGQRFTRLVVMRRAENGSNGEARWECSCDCGATTVVYGGHLARGRTRSCGCLARERSSALARERISAPVEGRFWKYVSPEPNSGCWLWTGSVRRGGYGKVRLSGEDGAFIASAHRFSYELHKGAIPDGLELDHLCRTRSCVNPAHLEPVTGAENIRRGMEARGYPQDPGLPQARRNAWLRERYKNDPAYRDIHKRRSRRRDLRLSLRAVHAGLTQYDFPRMLSDPKGFARLLRRQAHALGKLAGIEPPAELLASLKALETMG